MVFNDYGKEQNDCPLLQRGSSNTLINNCPLLLTDNYVSNKQTRTWPVPANNNTYR